MAMTRKQMQRWVWIALALVVLGVFKLGVLWYGWTGEAKPATAEMLACPDTARTCPLGDSGASLRFVTPPVHGKPFEIEVSGTGETPMARFEMPGMDMGVPPYRLIPAADRRWSARVMLPVCASGARDWDMRVDIGSKAYVKRFTAR